MNRLWNQGVLGCSKPVEQCFGGSLNDEHGMVSGREKLLLTHVLQKLEEGIVKTARLYGCGRCVIRQFPP